MPYSCLIAPPEGEKRIVGQRIGVAERRRLAGNGCRSVGAQEETGGSVIGHRRRELPKADGKLARRKGPCELRLS